MNKRQKLVQQQFLDNEEAVIKRLKTVYNKSLDDITKKAQELQIQINALDKAMESIEDAEELARLKSMKQSKVYQKQYQDALKKQVGSVLDNMHVEEFKTVSEYLNKCYEEGFMGTMFDLHGQGIPLCFPIDQEAMVRAVQLDSKISKGLYSRLGEDVGLLKRKIMAQVSRGISTGMSFEQVAQQLSAYTNIGFNNAVRIARTEGHRIQVQSGMDACFKAKEKGADVVKQWDATLDSSTRESHQKVDGEIRELDKPFSNGLMFPGDPSGGAAEVVNCRCALLQRAKWALDEDELQTLKDRAAYYGLDKADSFDEYKKKYLKAAEEVDVKNDLQITSILESCKTVSDVENIMREQDWFIHGTGELEGWRSDDELSLEGCDVESAKEVYKGYDTFFTKYPQMKGKLSAPNVEVLPKTVYAECTMGFGAEAVIVNKFHFKNHEKLVETMLKGVESGFSPKGTESPHSLIVHELGHALDGYLSVVEHQFGTAGKKRTDFVSNKLRPKVMKACGVSVSDIRTEVSDYATKDPKEWFGECMSEYLCSPNPRKVAKEFGRQIDEIMKGVK